MRRLRLLRALIAADRWIVCEALLLPLWIAVGFRVLGVSRTQAALRRWARSGPSSRHTLPEAGIDQIAIIRRARQVQLAVKRRTSLGTHCLVGSLTLWAMLLRRGIETDLRVGFRKRHGKTEGHAWVEHGGVPINEGVEETRTYASYEQPLDFDLWSAAGRSENIR